MVARPVLDRTSDYPLKRSWCPRFLRCDFGPTGPLDSVRQRSRSVEFDLVAGAKGPAAENVVRVSRLDLTPDSSGC
jgi:hypothetical protein